MKSVERAFMLMVLFSVLFTFFSCTNDKSKLIGKWEADRSGFRIELEFTKNLMTYKTSAQNNTLEYSIIEDAIKIHEDSIFARFKFINNNTIELSGGGGRTDGLYTRVK